MSKYKCEICEDRKYVLRNGSWTPCTCLSQLRLINKYNESGVPPIFRDYTWMDFFKDFPRMKRMWRVCRRIIKKVKKQYKCKFLYIRGEGSSGKQALISLLLKEFIHIGLSCRFVTLHDLIQLEFDKERKDEMNFIYNECDVVCLRIGTVIEHRYARYVLEKFYITRRNNRKYCIFTSRVDIGEQANIYGLEMKKLMKDGRRVLKIKMGK